MAISKPKPGRVIKTPATPGGDGLTALCEDLMRIVVSSNGGFPSTPGFARELVRVTREMYSEIEQPTVRPKQAKAKAMDYEEEEDGDYGR